MVSKVKDSSGKIVAYMEWRLVGQSGIEKLFGEYVWISEMWIHQDFRSGYAMYEMIEDVLESAPQAMWAYFRRRKYKGRVSKLYTREQFENSLRKVQTHHG